MDVKSPDDYDLKAEAIRQIEDEKKKQKRRSMNKIGNIIDGNFCGFI